jgi:hypothetical protein
MDPASALLPDPGALIKTGEDRGLPARSQRQPIPIGSELLPMTDKICPEDI